MTLQHHHAHIFIGTPNEHSRSTVLEYLETSGLGQNASDFHIQTMETFTIDHARDLKQLVSQKSQSHSKLVVVIETGHFSHPAQHALLKTLEEPQTGVTIIFITPHEHLLLPTLKSRVVVHFLAKSEIVSPIDVKIFERVNVAKRLHMVDEYLKKTKDDEGLHETARRDALSFLHAYESHLYSLGNVSKRQKEYGAIFFAKEYMTDSGSSVKQLLEYVALVK
jgi:DNA polymerase III delta prime subunit